MANSSIFDAFERMWLHVVAALGEKSDTTHSHDDMYYTETEIDTKLSELASDNAIASTYETKTDAAEKLEEAKAYTDSAVSGLDSSAATEIVNDHNTSNSAHNDIRTLATNLQNEFDSHCDDATHITSTERTNWNAAYTHSSSTHAPSNAEANQNAFSNIAVSGQTTVVADTKTDTVTFAGTNVSITTDATNDKVTFAVADGTTSTKGVVQLTDSVSSTSTTTAATPNSVKIAYDLAKSAVDGAVSTSHNHDDMYYTETEIDNMEFITTSDIDTICRAATITLEIEGTYYLAEEGMTWGEWCDSGYNTGGFYIDDSGYVYNGTHWVWQRAIVIDGSFSAGTTEAEGQDDTVDAEYGYYFETYSGW